MIEKYLAHCTWEPLHVDDPELIEVMSEESVCVGILLEHLPKDERLNLPVGALEPTPRAWVIVSFFKEPKVEPESITVTL